MAYKIEKEYLNREEEIVQQAIKEFPRFAERRVGFIAGAKWADEHQNIIWHDSNKEQPKPMSRVIVLNEYDNIDVITNVLEVFENKRWLYIDDLLPKN